MNDRFYKLGLAAARLRGRRDLTGPSVPSGFLQTASTGVIPTTGITALHARAGFLAAFGLVVMTAGATAAAQDSISLDKDANDARPSAAVTILAGKFTIDVGNAFSDAALRRLAAKG